MKIAIVGSREYPRPEFAKHRIWEIFRDLSLDSSLTLVSGGAKGIDSLAEEIAHQLNVKTQIFIPEWDKYGKSAGFRRNELIIKEADKVVAFWDGKSKGTKNSIDLAIAAGKPVDIYVRS